MSLEPLRAALLADVEADIARRLAAVEEECRRAVAAAEAEAEKIVGRGRDEGEAAAAKEALRRRATATRRAREIRLRGQQRQVEELERRSRPAVADLREDSRYGALLEQLRAAVREQLGADAEIEVDPGGLGGVIGRRGGASVDYTLPALAERALEGLGEEVDGLWR
jgi:vacuolar-type H+-ATPase subunit E/Vma4